MAQMRKVVLGISPQPWAAAVRGWRAAMTLVETSVVLIIVVAALSTGAIVYADYLKSQTAHTAAGQMIAVAQSFKKYVKDKYPTLVTEATPTGFYEVPITALTAPAAGDPQYLPAGFSNKSPYGQSYHLVVRKPSASAPDIEALVYTDGGEQIPPDQALAIAQAIGASGGFTLRGGSATQVHVTDGTELDLTSFGVTPSASGKLVSALFLGELDNDSNDYLYRVEVPGHPELNTMSTDLNMGGNSVNGALNVTATNNVTANNQVRAGGNVVAGNNVTATNGSVTAGANVTAAGNIRATGASSLIWSQGQIQSAGRLTAGEYLQINGTATEGASCSPNGLVARNSVGLLLSCQSGRWSTGGGGGLCRHGHVVGLGSSNSFINDSSCDWILFIHRTMNKDSHALVYLNGALVIDSWDSGYSVMDTVTMPVPVGASVSVGSSGNYPSSFSLYRN